MASHNNNKEIIMKLLSTMTIIASLLAPIAVQAKEISGVNVPEQITINDQSLQLNGAGIRSKFFIDLYVGSLYLPKASQDVADILNQPVAVIRLNITSGMITAEKMTDAINEGFDDATDNNTAPIASQISAFMSLFNSPINEGDQFTLVADKANGVTAYKNGKQQGEAIKGEAFRVALIDIWLGKEPSQKSLKQEMLGQ